MNKQGIWIVGFLLWISSVSAKRNIGKVYLEVIDQPIVFGESVHLFCNLSVVPDCCRNTVTWIRNINVIAHHGTSFDASKYAQIPAQTGFSLQINNFAETDLYAKFSCLYGFNKDSIVIGMEENKYERYPSSDEIRINEYLDKKNNVFVIDIVFEGVLPMPSCILLSNDHDLKTQVGIKHQSIGMFYNVSIQLKLSYSLDDCQNNITLKCSIGGYNMSRALKHVIPCSEVPYNNSDHKNDDQVIIMICLLCLLIGFPLVVVIGILLFKHVYLSSKGQWQGDRLESIKTDQQGPVLESKASTKTHGHMNKSSNARSWFASHSQVTQKEKGERQESISLLEAHERGDRLESIETDEQDESLDSTALLETCEPGDRLESIETDEQGPVLESKASMETHEQMNKYNFIPMQKDRHVRECLKLRKKKKKKKNLGDRLESMETDEQGPVLESNASMETHEQMNKYNYIPIQKDRQVRERLKQQKKGKKEENLVEGKKIPFLKEKLGKVE